MTQFERILSHLRKQPHGATTHELLLVSGGNSCWKRIEECTSSMGDVLADRLKALKPIKGERIQREYALHEGRYITVFKLTKA